MTSEPRLLVGVDWATQAHQVCVLDPSGAILDERSVPATGDGLFGLVDRLRTSCPEDPAAIFVSIEVTHGPVVETLMDAGFTVFAINPKQLDRFRDRHTLAGAKDDRRDAYVLADSLRTDRHLFRELEPEHALVIQLREWSRMTDDLGRDRVRVGNRIREQLRRYAPQFLELEEDVSREWLLDLWELLRVPSRAQRIHTGTIAKLLAKHRIRRVDAEKVRAVLCQRSVTVAPGTQESAIAHIDLAIQRMRASSMTRRSSAPCPG